MKANDEEVINHEDGCGDDDDLDDEEDEDDHSVHRYDSPQFSYTNSRLNFSYLIQLRVCKLHG